MKKITLAVLVLAAIAAGLIVAYKEMSQERAREGEAESAVVAESRVRRGSQGEAVIHLDADVQSRLALTIAPAGTATLPRESKAYGRVLDPALLAALLADLSSAVTALDLSQQELQRAQALFAQDQNVPRRALETAAAAVRRNQIATDAARMKLVSAWGRSVAEHPRLTELVKSLVARQTALVRLDLPAGETPAAPQGARVFTLASADQPSDAEFLGPAADTDPQTQGQGCLFLVKSAASDLRPGQALVGYLKLPGEPLTGVRVPSSGVVRAAGQAWVYVQTAGTNFTRREIALDHPAAGGWLITRGLSAQDRLVVTGAQMLLSEELKSRIQLGN